MRLNLLKFVCFTILLFSLNLFAQTKYNAWQDNEKLDVILLKKDLLQTMKEAESASPNNTQNLIRRLNLYYRAAHLPKISATLKQIIESPDFEKNRNGFAGSLSYFLKDEIFTDARILQTYLQKTETFHDGIYDKFVYTCSQNQENCDVAGFDEWLARQTAESVEKTDEQVEQRLAIRIDFRKRMNLETAEILEPFASAVRENSMDLKIALRYLKYFHTATETEWLLQNYTSKQAYDYLEITEKLFHKVQYFQIENDERQRIARVGVSFLQKSLSLPFDKKDTALMWQYRLSPTPVPIKLENPEKQLRFWTKMQLAELYKILSEAQNAQPLIEELAAMDKSDIFSEDLSFLAGAVQSVSGARVIESKILGEQAMRQDSVNYWFERIQYYRGRNENRLVIDSYKQMLAAFPFDLDKKNDREFRLKLLYYFGDFADGDLRGNDELQKEVESFFGNEFRKHLGNAEFSYKLLNIILDADFDDLADEIFVANKPLLTAFFVKLPFADLESDIFGEYLKSEAVSKADKDAFFADAEKSISSLDFKKTLLFSQIIIRNFELKEYAPRVIPVLLKNVEKIETNLKNRRLSEKKILELKNMRGEMLSVLCSAYLTINDWRSAEKLMVIRSGHVSDDGLVSLIYAAVRNNDFADVVKIWKIRSNLDRRKIEMLSSLKHYPILKQNLIEFYTEMKQNELYSPIPEKALQMLEQK